MSSIKIALILPYFGKFPKYSVLFFHSLRYNPNINLFLITDQDTTEINFPQNVILIKISFDKFKEKIQTLFDFQISLETPYKLCDYKPIYGLLLEDELGDYDFWGYCDMDMILGDIQSFLSTQIVEKFDKIYQFGHLTLFRNSKENNRRFMLDGGISYKHAFTTPVITVFDEVIGIQKKFILLGIPTYLSNDCADISPWHDRFVRVTTHVNVENENINYKQQVFFWENGKVYRAFYNKDNETIEYEDFNYLHFQKRNLSLDLLDNIELSNSFYISKKGFVPKVEGFNVSLNDIKILNGFSIFRETERRIAYHRFIWKRRFNKYILKK